MTSACLTMEMTSNKLNSSARMPADTGANEFLWIKSLIDSKLDNGVLQKPSQYRAWVVQTKGKLLKKGLCKGVFSFRLGLG